MANSTFPLLAPGLAGYHWRHTQAEVFPSTSILTLLELTFDSSFDITNGNTPAGRTWVAVIEYLATLHDCSAFYFGQIMERPNAFLILVCLNNGRSWQNFQESLGTNLVLGMLAAKPVNRCLQMDTSDFEGHDIILEIILFTLQSGVSDQTRTVFEGHWKHLATNTMSSNNSSTTFGQWLEPVVPNMTSADMMAATQTAANDQPVIFLGFLMWNKNEFEMIPNKTKYNKWIQLAADLAAKPDLGTSKATIQLAKGNSNRVIPVSPPMANPSGHAVDCMAALFSSLPPRKQRNETGMWRNIDMVTHESFGAIARRERRFPGPAGNYVRMGEVNQHHMPTLYRHDFLPRPPYFLCYFAVDVIWLSFEPGLLDISEPSDQVTETFLMLRLALGKQEECETVLWGRDQEDTDNVAVLIFWKNSSSRATALEKHWEPSEHFAPLSPWLTSSSYEAQTFPLNSSLNSERHLELNSFFTPLHHTDKNLFEKCYHDFQMTTTTRDFVGFPPRACKSFFGGWQEQPVIHSMGSRSTQEQCLRFTGVLAWESTAARTQWYSEFSRGMMQSYERLGHIIDALNVLAIGGVETRILEMAREDGELLRKRLNVRDAGRVFPLLR